MSHEELFRDKVTVLFNNSKEEGDKTKLNMLLNLDLLESKGVGIANRNSLSFAGKVLLNKLELLKLPVNFKTLNGLVALDLLSDGDEGFIQIFFIHILKEVSKASWNNLSVSDIVMAIGNTIPSKAILEGLWGSQKKGNYNLVDNYEYWYNTLGLAN